MAEEPGLVAALRCGDHVAFDAVYERYRPRVFGFVLRMTGDRMLAEDLLQETFLRLAATARTLPPDTRLGPFLFTVARNLFVDQRRRALLDFDRIRDLRLWPSRPRRYEPTPLELSEASETARRVEAALQSLPDSYREVVLLCAVE